MSQNPTVSVIVTSYNQVRTLKLLFASLERQTFRNFEVVIADDGSSDETEVFCYAPHTFAVQFISQKDQGYRKSKILNEALRQVKADYLIFLDGDVILERHFIEDHIHLRKTGHFVCGRRVDLGERISSKLTVAGVQNGKFDHLDLNMIFSRLIKDTQFLKRGIRIPYTKLRQFFGYDTPLDILGSNLGAWTSDIKDVNGFNESMESYWGEDGDLYIRLRNSGKKSIGAKGLCIQFHVFHKRRVPTQENEVKYQLLLSDHQYKWAVKGYQENK